MSLPARKCVACEKTVYPQDDSVLVEGGIVHRPCFKCSHGKEQLSLITMAAFKGKLYCKTHLKELFLLRGKYDDIKPDKAEEMKEKAAAVKASSDGGAVATSASANEQVEAAAPAAEASAPAPAAAAAAEAPAAAPGGEAAAPVSGADKPSSASEAEAVARAAGLSVKERVAAQKAAAEAAAAEKAATPAATGKSSRSLMASADKEAAAAAAVEKAAAEAAAAEKAAAAAAEAAAAEKAALEKAAAEEAAAAAKVAAAASAAAAAAESGAGLSVKERLALQVSVGKKDDANSSAPASPASKSPRVLPGIGGGANKCSICTKTVYPLEMQSWDTRCYHKECFKCAQCKGPLSIKNVASINSTLYCKTHYMQIFSLKGKYSDFSGNVSPSGGAAAKESSPAAEAPATAEAPAS